MEDPVEQPARAERIRGKSVNWKKKKIQKEAPFCEHKSQKIYF